MKKIIVTNPMIGICYMQVCAEKTATDQEILEVCNLENPSGTTAGWGIVIRSTEQDGTTFDKKFLPVECADNKEREHLIVVC